jgi:carbonic anhydrase
MPALGEGADRQEVRHMHSKSDSIADLPTACGCGHYATETVQPGAHLAVPRRGFLRVAFAGTAAALAGVPAIGVPPAAAQKPSTPDAALKDLMDGNQRYLSGQLQSFQEDLDLLKAKTAEKQEPFAAVLSCADSRVPVETIFDQSIGEIFVVRVAGNVATPEIIASLEYGIAVLGTKVLMVLGHTNCGAVKAAIEGKAVPGQISALYASIQPAVDAAGPDLNATIDANAGLQAMLLSRASPLIAAAIKEGKLQVVAARYDIATGQVSLLT